MIGEKAWGRSVAPCGSGYNPVPTPPCVEITDLLASVCLNTTHDRDLIPHKNEEKEKNILTCHIQNIILLYIIHVQTNKQTNLLMRHFTLSCPH